MAHEWKQAGFLEKMLGPLPGKRENRVRWVGDPIREHLGLMLNTRRGSVPGLPDYGLPDVSNYYSDYPASLAALRTAVEEMIRKYEPRVQKARVRVVESETTEFRVSLLIVGEIEDDDGSTQVQWRTTISSSGHAHFSD